MRSKACAADKLQAEAHGAAPGQPGALSGSLGEGCQWGVCHPVFATQAGSTAMCQCAASPAADTIVSNRDRGRGLSAVAPHHHHANAFFVKHIHQSSNPQRHTAQFTRRCRSAKPATTTHTQAPSQYRGHTVSPPLAASFNLKVLCTVLTSEPPGALPTQIKPRSPPGRN